MAPSSLSDLHRCASTVYWSQIFAFPAHKLAPIPCGTTSALTLTTSWTETSHFFAIERLPSFSYATFSVQWYLWYPYRDVLCLAGESCQNRRKYQPCYFQYRRGTLEGDRWRFAHRSIRSNLLVVATKLQAFLCRKLWPPLPRSHSYPACSHSRDFHAPKDRESR